MREQLAFDFQRGLPVPVSPLAVRRAACRALREMPNASARAGFALREHLEEVALLQQIRAGCREQARELKRAARQRGTRMKGLAFVTFACSLEGRRAFRLMDRLSERIGARESGLCA